MTERMSLEKAAPGALKAMLGLHAYLHRSGLEHALMHIIDLRASQMNGCAYCVDMHWKDARLAGVSEQKLSMLPVWRESNLYTERERAALEWTEAVTFVADSHVPDDVYRMAREQFSEAELANLTLAIGAINSWNRLNIAFRKEAGTYDPEQLARKMASLSH